jgi:sulfoxide reductase heme-binding subunit YedZ
MSPVNGFGRIDMTRCYSRLHGRKSSPSHQGKSPQIHRNFRGLLASSGDTERRGAGLNVNIKLGRILFEGHAWTWPIRLGRTLGLLGFGYVLLHALVYAALDQTGNLRAILQDVTKRKFIFVGCAAFVLLIPLALTSTAASIRRLGSKKRKRLHRLAYVIGILGVIHFIWRVKSDLTEPLIYATILTVLLLTRIGKRIRDRAKAARSVAGAA